MSQAKTKEKKAIIGKSKEAYSCFDFETALIKKGSFQKSTNTVQIQSVRKKLTFHSRARLTKNKKLPANT